VWWGWPAPREGCWFSFSVIPCSPVASWWGRRPRGGVWWVWLGGTQNLLVQGSVLWAFGFVGVRHAVGS
jgi:hypothetical protein